MLTIIYLVGLLATIHILTSATHNSRVYAEERSKDLVIFVIAIGWPMALLIAILSVIFLGFFYSMGFILRVTGLSYLEHNLIQFLPKRYKEDRVQPLDDVDKSKRILVVEVNNVPPKVLHPNNPEFKGFGVVVAVDEEDHTFRFIINRLSNDTTTIFNLDEFENEMEKITSSEE